MTKTALHRPQMPWIGNKIRKIQMIALALMMAIGGAVTAASGAQVVGEVNVNDGYAVHGYDVVAYFTVSEPTEGDDRFTAEHQGVRYRFASAENRDRFNGDPAKYAPQLHPLEASLSDLFPPLRGCSIRWWGCPRSTW